MTEWVIKHKQSIVKRELIILVISPYLGKYTCRLYYDHNHQLLYLWI